MGKRKEELLDLVRMQKEILVEAERDLGAGAIVLEALESKQDSIKTQIADAKLEIKILQAKLRRL